jgi:hypothetical protein
VEWSFEEVLDVTDGRHRAPVARFVGSDGTRTDMIVKCIGRQLSQRSLCCEYFGNAIAREMRLNTPAPYLLNLPQDAANAMNSDGRLRAAGVTIPPGLAVGSEWLRPGTTPGLAPRLIGIQAEEAARIYAYDLMLQQPDRTVRNPNLIEVRGHFVAIDFETSCSFLFDVLPDVAPWRVSKAPYVKDHFFRSRLSPDTVDWRALIFSMLTLDLERISVEILTLPRAWHDDCARTIRHIEILKDRSTDLIWEIIRTLTRPLT